MEDHIISTSFIYFVFQFSAQVARERERYQPTKLESFFAITKTLIIRGLIIYFITSFFRRPATVEPGPGGAVPTKVPAFNIFENGTVMVSIIKYLALKDIWLFEQARVLIVFLCI